MFAQVAHGDRNVITLAGSECPQPPPRSHQFCNVIDCPVDWDVGPWTKVSQIWLVIYCMLWTSVPEPD